MEKIDEKVEKLKLALAKACADEIAERTLRSLEC